MTTKHIPILRPKLPDADALQPWLRRMDAARWYTNNGPLEQEFRHRLSEHFDGAATVTASSGTSALSLALKNVARNSPPNALVMIPAFTFIATALAVVQAGFVPWIVDVDEATWALKPELAQSLISKAPGELAAVVPVAPFGALADVAIWDDFTDRTSIPVVMDGAACFDSLRPGTSPAIVSLHATKAFGVGEGGVVVTKDKKLAEAILWSSNFGFQGTRVSEIAGTNAKMSELMAAMGLAQFDRWPEVQRSLRNLAAAYCARFENMPGVSVAPGLMDGTPSTLNIQMSQPVDAVIENLARHNIEARQWWMKGLESHPSLDEFPRTPLPVTRALGETVLGLPLSVDMTEDDVEYVVNALDV